MVLVCLLLAAPIGLSPLHILTLCGSECVLVVSTQPLDDLSGLTTSFPLPPSALCTIFGQHGLPCPVTSPCVSLSSCPVSSGLSMFVLSWGVKGGGVTCCSGEGRAMGMGRGSSRPVPLRRKILLKGAPCWCRCTWCWWLWPLASAGPHIPVCPGRSFMLFDGLMALAGAVVCVGGGGGRLTKKLIKNVGIIPELHAEFFSP